MVTSSGWLPTSTGYGNSSLISTTYNLQRQRGPLCPRSWLKNSTSCVHKLIYVRLFATPWTVAHQAPLSMGFSRQEYWSGLLFPTPGDLPYPRIEPTFLVLPALAGRFFTPGPTWKVTQKSSTFNPSCTSLDHISIPESNVSQIQWLTLGDRWGSASLNPPGAPHRNQGIFNRDNAEIDTDGATNRGLTTGRAIPEVFEECWHQFRTFWRQMSLKVCLFVFNLNLLKFLSCFFPLYFILFCLNLQVALVVKNLPASSGGVRDTGLIPSDEGMATHSSILAWRIPWTEEPGGLQSMGSQSQTELK